MMREDILKNYEILQKEFSEVFRDKWDESELSNFSDLEEKFVFHMCDASFDIDRLADRLRAPGSTTAVEFGELLFSFFIHAVPHLMAAAQIYAFIPKTFAEQDEVHSFPDEPFEDEEE